MSNRLSTALTGGGEIVLVLHAGSDGSMRLQVTENWQRLTSVQKADIPAASLAASGDPDALIFRTAAALLDAVHINHAAHEPAEPVIKEHLYG